MQDIILSPISLADLKTAISNIIDEKIKPFLPATVLDPENNEIYLSRKEVSKQLKISLPTLNNLTKQGAITGYRIGKRVLYKKSDINSALHLIDSNKYKRKGLVSNLPISYSNL